MRNKSFSRKVVFVLFSSYQRRFKLHLTLRDSLLTLAEVHRRTPVLKACRSKVACYGNCNPKLAHTRTTSRSRNSDSLFNAIIWIPVVGDSVVQSAETRRVIEGRRDISTHSSGNIVERTRYK